ncbi:alpha-amylase family protein [Nocardioides sp.]|uniref:alpha-amylase family protein n=1 Tax=Nocardioides sp. TaxID=35761 RepID=UPI002B26BBD1|nr:alpha-amylase family protein [Nocardioides sp.]
MRTFPLPTSAVEAARTGLASAGGVPSHRAATFHARLERWWPDLRDAVGDLHPAAAETVAARLVTIAARGFAERPDDLHGLDERRLLRPDWIQQPDRFGYACYADRFAGDLAGIERRLDHLEDLGVTYLHLMPLLQPREGDNDGGYAVQDYRAVRADLGTVDDLRDLATRLRGRGISLVVDLVLNHVAREHEWAAAARAGDEKYRDYFHLFADRDGPAGPDAYEQTLLEVFPDFAPGSFTFDDDLQAWVWTTFNSFQWDLDWSNADVLAEFADLVLFLANLGVEVLRLDAIAFLWKRLGTDCQNQPEVHAITQALRTVARLAAPATLFKAEAIVGPRDLVGYLGLGRHAGRVSDLAYHNSLMVQIWSMLAAGNTILARHALAALPQPPATGTWITYLRCHDDIGWAIDDADTAAVGLGGGSHRAFLSDYYAGDFPGSPAEGLVFQENPATGDRRISGTAASLTGLGERRLDPSGGLARLLLGHTIVAGWGGVPVVWSGDELALPNDAHWADEPGHERDNRWAHRPRVSDEVADRRHDPTSEGGQVFHAIARLARVRASLPQLHAAATVEVLTDTDDALLVVVRRHASGVMVGLYNVGREHRAFPLWRLEATGLAAPYDALSGERVAADGDGLVWLAPYAARWVVEAPER